MWLQNLEQYGGNHGCQGWKNAHPRCRPDALNGVDRGCMMSKKIEKTLASLLFALVTSGGSSKMH
jgi:hypothetical protein